MIKDYLNLLYLSIKDLFFLCDSASTCIERCKEINNIIYVCIHEWGGYELVRHKHINNKIKDWECGLKYQLERFNNYKGGFSVDLTVTMSDINLHHDLDYIRSRCDRVIPVSNIGMDFSGYSTFYNFVKEKDDSYIILTNTSVSSIQTDFIDDYIEYMQNNLDVGMLGISCCSKCYQTLVRNNFTPHLQSFFLLTTIGVLNEMVSANNGDFPGIGISNKQLLIREGEIKISQLVLGLGYKLAVVTESGVIKFNNNEEEWTLPKGDYRYYTSTPNVINKI